MSTMSAGTSCTTKFSGWPESSQMCALRVSRSTTPENSPSVPIGSTITSALAPSTLRTCFTTR
jgi:hypothetical protein